MKPLRLALFAICLWLATAVETGAATWEYATLEKLGQDMGASVSWQSPKGGQSARNTADLVKKLVAAGEIRAADVTNFFQLLQALGAMGWELVQVESTNPAGAWRTYYFKRQTS